MNSKTTDRSFCGWCTSGNHRLCHGAIPRPPEKDVERFSHCDCADSGHRPDPKLAAAMACSLRPDLARDRGPLLTEVVDWVVATANAFADTQENNAA